MNHIHAKLLQRLGACAAIAAVIVGTLPGTTAYVQGASPLPTPPPPTVSPKPTTKPPAATAIPRPTPKPTSAPTRPPKTVPAPKLITKRIQQTDAKAFYEIDMKYPAVDSAVPMWAAFNTLAESQVQDAISAFKKDVAAAGVFTATGLPTNTLSSEWDSFRVSNDFVSVRQTISVYMAGAAHPNYFSRTINFDVRTGKAIALGDLFKQVNTDYLGALSTYCKRVLKRAGHLDFPEGADPKPTNYDRWNIGRFNLVISFDPYQVTPYAVGRVECEVPLRSLRRILADPRRW